jgi:hypothetical protein
MGGLKRRMRQRFGDEIIRNGDAVCMTDGFVEMFLNVEKGKQPSIRTSTSESPLLPIANLNSGFVNAGSCRGS